MMSRSNSNEHAWLALQRRLLPCIIMACNVYVCKPQYAVQIPVYPYKFIKLRMHAVVHLQLLAAGIASATSG